LLCLIDGELQTIAKWQKTGGYEKIKALSEIKKSHPAVYKYLQKAGMLEQSKENIKPQIKLKLPEGEYNE